MTNTEAEIKWLGLTLRSESDQPHEWSYLCWAIRNRVLSKRYPNTYQAVVLSNKQFSYFNQFSQYFDDPERLYLEALEGYAGDFTGWSENDLTNAEKCAGYVMRAERWQAPFGVGVMHYWSQQSMVPKGTRPAWAASAKRLFTPSGIDQLRFIFAEGVK